MLGYWMNLLLILDKAYRSLAIRWHQFTQWCVLLDFEMHHTSILSSNLKIDMLITLEYKNSNMNKL